MGLSAGERKRLGKGKRMDKPDKNIHSGGEATGPELMSG